MSSSQAPRAVHQDYIARIRYTNTLPPPPNPPKLLDIPNTGFTSGRYTETAFASRLAREQPLNIEADAELGMPLDLVGMPGIFDGDESSIQAPSTIPVPHPHDRALLRPLSTLGKPKFSDAGVSFLRRTEYISSHTSKSRFDSTTSKSLISNTGNRGKRAVQDIDKEAPEAIKKLVEDGFKIAVNSLKNLQYIKHPTKQNLKLVDAFPILRDTTSMSDVGGYVEFKFFTNPVPPSSTYDTRLECSILRPKELSEEEKAIFAAATEAHARDPDRNPVPEVTLQYEFYMAETAQDAAMFKRKWDPLDPEHDEDLYTFKNNDGVRCFRYKKVRAYESGVATGSMEQGFEDEVVLALHDGTDGIRQRAAYYYPLVQKTLVRPQRNKHIEAKRLRLNNDGDDEGGTDYIDIRIDDPTETTRGMREPFIENPWGNDADPEAVKAGGSPAATAPAGAASPPNDEDAENSDE